MTPAPEHMPLSSSRYGYPCGYARPRLYAQLCVLLALGLAAACAIADEDPCAKFSWNVVRERALFATAPQSIIAGREPTSTPLLAPERLYQLQLGPQRQVALLLSPGKKTLVDGAYAGLVRLQLQQPGAYRMSVDQPAWIDVVDERHVIDSADFQGRPGCLAPHKIVQYLLPAGRELVLQFSSAAGPQLRLTITHVD
ncbi:MAG TPA: hypothetical protein VN925_03635 [Steroidobacteraceae bacterium]|nr:hypothetical protein [Steroidobacteraceae bacterium]